MRVTAHHCTEHDDCTVIIGGNWPKDAGSWISHAESGIDPKARVSEDIELVDLRSPTRKRRRQ